MDFKLSNEDLEKIKSSAFTTNEIARYREVLTALVFNKDQRQWTIRTDVINYAEIVSQFSTAPSAVLNEKLQERLTLRKKLKNVIGKKQQRASASIEREN